MTVLVSKPAVNLREELASLRNQGGYQEQQFYFDGLVTNGTFDSDTSGWTPKNANTTLSVVGNQLSVLTDGETGYAYQAITTVAGQIYRLTWDADESTGDSYARIFVGTTEGSSNLVSHTVTGIETGLSITFVATSTTTYITLYNTRTTPVSYALFDNISVFEVDANGDVIHTMPKGWKPKDVFEDGLLQREGAAHDYEVVYDGFDYVVKPTVAPSATTQTCVIGVKA